MKKFTLSLCILQLALCTLNIRAQSQLWGMTSAGGDGFGTIFKTDGNGNNHQVMETFGPGIQGFWPVGNKFIEMPNGKLLGVTSFDALYSSGVIFEFDPSTNVYVKKINFGTAGGRTPNGALMKASNGKLYGLTSYGGANGKGVIYEYDYSTNTYTKKVDFDGLNGNAVFGIGGLTEAPNGKLYGMTGRGGTNDEGVIFEYDRTTNTYTKKFDMDSATGRFPLNSLLLAGNGKFYGTTRDGGANNRGVIFEYDYTTNTYTKKADLNQPNGWDAGSIMQASNGKLYGMTRFGGSGGGGVILEYNITTNTLSKKIDLIGDNGEGGIGVLMQASNGKLYGTTLYGGIGGDNHNEGVVFEYDFTTNTYVKKIDLNFAIKGNNPGGSLVKASNGKLYGSAKNGGVKGLGVIFEYNLSGSIYSKKYDFDSLSGYEPIGSLVEANNGKLYGMANGGANAAGVIYEYDPATNTYTKKIDLISATGNSPSGSLMKASNGKLYGTTSLGGSTNDGVIFEYNPATNTYTKKIDINGNSSGSRPVGSLVQAGNGKLYGMTGVGSFGLSPGWIYEYDIATNTYSKTVNFTAANGRDPLGSLTMANNGKLYGMTSSGGANNNGVIFEYDPLTQAYVKKFDFNGTNGEHPSGTLMQASNGNLYGMSLGGAYNDGIIFEYDYINNIFAKTFDFNTTNGASPTGTSLIEIITTVTGIAEATKEMQFMVYPNPSNNVFTVNYSTPAKGKISLTVTNLLGAIIYSESKRNVTGEYSGTIDLSKYPKGIYFLELVSGEERLVKKIVLQ
ncbi:MAG: choice-of-anchor tandem repeat GloVer-containing protein [Chitinophagaceae bacterium]